MILSNYDFPTLRDHQRMMDIGAQSAEVCRSLVIEADGNMRPLQWHQHRGDKLLRLSNPIPLEEERAAAELMSGEGHRVVGIIIYAQRPTLAELGVGGDDDHLRVVNLQRWFFRVEAKGGGHLVGQVHVLEVVNPQDAERDFVSLKDSLEAHHISPEGEMNVISWAGSDAWVTHLQGGGFRRRG